MNLPQGPLLVLPICPPGGGKSTFSKENFKPSEIICIDEYREKLCDDINNQFISDKAFKIADILLEQRIIHRLRTIIDSTNLTETTRRHWLRMINEYSIISEFNHIKSTAIMFDIDLKTILKFNKARSRQVPEDIIKKFYDRHINTSLESLINEGFDYVYTYNPITKKLKSAFVV